MNTARLVEDRLRAEYVSLLPALQRTLHALQTEVSYLLLPATRRLSHYERILIRGRVKDCESAVDKLRRRQEGGRFDPDQADRYSLLSLTDLVGVQVLTFPPRHLSAASNIILRRVPGWKSDHIAGPGTAGNPIASKYHGVWDPNDLFECEIQVVSLLIGLFWEVEHSAIYKPSPILRGVAESREMEVRTSAVLTALREFEEAFDRQVEESLELNSSA
jgi:hypothetical protein